MNALAYCAEIAGARRRIWRQGGKPPCQIARRQRALEAFRGTPLGEHAGRTLQQNCTSFDKTQ